MQFLTDFFDQAVTLPLAVGIGLALALRGWRRGTLAWAASSVACWSAMLALKLGFDVCGPERAAGVLANPSGHTASGTFVYAGLVTLLAGRAAALPAAAAIAGLIGFSRVALGAHSAPDVLVGGAVGIACVWLLSVLAWPRPTVAAYPSWTAALVVAPLLLHGTHLAAEERIHAFARDWAVWPLSLCTAPEAAASRALSAHGSHAAAGALAETRRRIEAL